MRTSAEVFCWGRRWHDRVGWTLVNTRCRLGARGARPRQLGSTESRSEGCLRAQRKQAIHEYKKRVDGFDGVLQHWSTSSPTLLPLRQTHQRRPPLTPSLRPAPATPSATSEHRTSPSQTSARRRSASPTTPFPLLPVFPTATMNTTVGSRLMWAGILFSGLGAHHIGKAAARDAAVEEAARAALYDAVHTPSALIPPPLATVAVGGTADDVLGPVTAAAAGREHRLIQAGGVLAAAAGVALLASAAGVRPPAMPNRLMHARILAQGLSVVGIGGIGLNAALKKPVF